MAVGAKYRDQAKPIWQDARATRQSLQAELGKAQPDDATLTQLEDRLASDRQQMMAIHQQRNAELKKELTPKQYAELMLRRPRFGRHMHRGEGGQGGGAQQ
jgi:Spy/CpxP family protein refolding chaperone